MTRSFPEIESRLKRAHGHLAGVIQMLGRGRPCLELAQQLQAVERAIANAKKQLIKDHLNHCLEETSGSLPQRVQTLIEEFQGVTKYL
jgi:DNA-binding FrmR family transcriptional regulator